MCDRERLLGELIGRALTSEDPHELIRVANRAQRLGSISASICRRKGIAAEQSNRAQARAIILCREAITWPAILSADFPLSRSSNGSACSGLSSALPD